MENTTCSCTLDNFDPTCEIEWHAAHGFRERGWTWRMLDAQP